MTEISNEGISGSGDPRHQDLLEKYFGMNKSTKTLNKNGYPEEEEDEEDLSKEEAREFRMLAARLNCMAQDNPYMQLSAKEACRGMARPKMRDFAKVKKREVLEGARRGEVDVPHAVRRGGVEDQGVRGQRLGRVQGDVKVHFGRFIDVGKPSVEDVVDDPGNGCDFVRRGRAHRDVRRCVEGYRFVLDAEGDAAARRDRAGRRVH